MSLNLDFPELDRKKWDELIAKALKINSLDDFKPNEVAGISIPAFNHPEDKIEVNNPLINHNSDWKIALSIDTGSQNAHSAIMNALQNGAEAIVLQGPNPDWNNLYDEVFHEMIYTDIHSESDLTTLSKFIEFSETNKRNLDKLTGSFLFSEETLKANMDTAKKLPSFHFFTGDSSSENIPDALFEISSKLKKAIELCTETGLAVSSIRASVSVDAHLPVNVSKLRALRIIWANLLKAHKIEFQALFIKAITKVNPEANNETALIENTSACINAALGTADMICAFHSDDMNQARLHQNIQHIMKMESNMQYVSDPLAGSYAIEKMTNHLAKACWEKLVKN